MNKATFPLPDVNGNIFLPGLDRPVPAVVANAIQTLGNDCLWPFGQTQLKDVLEQTKFPLTADELCSILVAWCGLSEETAKSRSSFLNAVHNQ